MRWTAAALREETMTLFRWRRKVTTEVGLKLIQWRREIHEPMQLVAPPRVFCHESERRILIDSFPRQG